MTENAVTASGDWCSQHRSPADGCLTRSHNYTVRLRGDVMLAAHQRARRQRLNLSEVVRAFVEDWAAGSAEEAFIAALEQATEKDPVSTARLITVSGRSRDWVADRLTILPKQGYITRVAMGRYAHVPGADLREGLRVAGAIIGGRDPHAGNGRARYDPDMDQVRAEYEDGATVAEIGERLGMPEPTLHRYMDAAGIPRRQGGPRAAPPCGQPMRGQVACGRPSGHPGRHLSGASLRRQDENHRRAAAGAGGASSVPAPAVVTAEPTDAREATSAAKGQGPRRSGAATRKLPAVGPSAPVAANGQQAVIAELRERVPDLVTAGELAAPVFRAGPDVDCLHENMRIRKGVCPDCKQWVTK